MRSGAKVAVVGGVFAVVAGGVGYGGYNLWNGVTGGDSAVATRSEAVPEKRSGPVTPEETTATAKDFLAAWAAGESDRAAQLTNDPVAAGPALLAYKEGAKVSKAVITPGTPVGTKVPFTVRATVSYEGVSKDLSYASELTVVRGTTTGRPLVRWRPAVLHPKLTAGATLRTGTAKVASVKAVDRNGVELTEEKYPSLGLIIDTLRQRYGARAGGTTGVETWIDSGSETVADTPLLVLRKGKPGTIETTIDAGTQAAAEKAVKAYSRAAVAAVEPSTGAIRAVANSPAEGFNTAFQGAQAPGSTMKIVTSAMIMQHGLGGPGSPVECSPEASWKGVTFHNLGHSSFKGGTLAKAFRTSCNTAFLKKALGPLGEKDLEDGALGETARRYFGIGLTWQVGVQAWDGSVPVSQGGETAASYIGQGKVTMSALNVASLSATVRDGGFRQPYLVAKEYGDREFATAERLPGEIASGLRQMMKETATEPDGTATRAMAGVPGPKGAKTGSAEVDGQGTSNSWFTGYSGDLAAAAVVEAGGHGGDAAGPVVARVLKAG
ncbi:penicillin-binding transpeptidase domain-containing protein [Streptomyces sp. WAC08241]|uniref:penicillin-binding transpeptidase domain-containing protein n=1 Tax=Streptomyces sp. WAC08241 TaxID=2487421 RepID=UPI000F7A029D|nr:penicillin-binding transpeptidase domain-containing protein [Streptomyces sp. WAC08241]RSS33709.1 penicillin-binding protein [Streptomyces sp. WAC08241]